jgi:hypothetical protein
LVIPRIRLAPIFAFWHLVCRNALEEAGVNDRTLRNLVNLEESASTARVLNLLRVYRRSRNDPNHAAKPFFNNPTLNKALLLKHRIRRNERELFFDGRRTATKIIFPIDGQDLKLGGRFTFVDQINFENMITDLLGESWLSDRSDRELLGIIDKLPSLDPFLLREQLRRHGRDPARCYFEISDSDMARMFKFVEREVQKLVDLCFQSAGADDGGRGARLTKKILSATVDTETEPLRLTLRLEKRDFQEGVFCWKGFLYYKWSLNELLADAARVSSAVAQVKIRGSADSETLVYLSRTRASLQKAILGALESARRALRFYDTAFASLVDGRPQAFRDFLLSAPSMFCELGERLGAINHIVSFWNFRFPRGQTPMVTGEELADILADFEDSLAFTAAAPAQSGWVDL